MLQGFALIHRLKYFLNPHEAVLGNELKLIYDGPDILHSLLQIIHEAKYRIFISIYYFSEDQSGQAILNALIKAKERGCEVRVVYDAMGSLFTRTSFFDILKKAGVEGYAYHSLWPLRLDWKFAKRNHRKIICVDSNITMIGGFNFSNPYFAPLDRNGYFDLAIQIVGDATSQAFHFFDQAWQKTMHHDFRFSPKKWIEKRRKSRSRNYGSTMVQVIGNDHFSERWKIRREILHVFSNASESIDIMNPYFLPDPAIIKSLVSARRRGVRVRILVPSYTDVKAIDLASMVIFRRMMKEEVEVYQWPGFLHAKAIVVDQKWSSIGSYNLDYRSLFHNLEIVVHALDLEFSKVVFGLFNREIERSRRMTPSDWDNMSVVSKAIARIIYRLRAFL